MSKKMGRPKLPANKTKGILIGARFSHEEARQVNLVAKNYSQSNNR
jgi:hypothetical protein